MYEYGKLQLIRLNIYLFKLSGMQRQWGMTTLQDLENILIYISTKLAQLLELK